MNIFNLFKKEMNKAIESIEGLKLFFAKGLKKIQGNKNVDKAEEALVELIIKAVELKTGATVSQDIRAQIKTGFVLGLDEANIRVVNFLEK